MPFAGLMWFVAKFCRMNLDAA